MDAYAFVRETSRDGLGRLAGLVDANSAVVSYIPLIGAYAAFVKVSHEDPVVVRETFDDIADIDDLIGVDTFVGSSPLAHGDLDLPLRSIASRSVPTKATLSDSVSSELGLVRPPLPIPMPTGGGTDALVAFVHLTTEPGATTEVYGEVAGLSGVVGLAVVAGQSVGVLVELTARDEHALAVAAEMVASVVGVDDVSMSVGAVGLASGFTRL